MFSLFGKKKADNTPSGQLLWLKTDIHCHVLPGIDDGAKDIDESLAMLREYERQGIQNVVATSHIKTEQFPNTIDTITEAWNLLTTAAGKEGININLKFAAEYYLDAHFLSLVENDELLLLPEKYILVETSLSRAPMEGILDVSAALVSKGITPILAHPERYLYWKHKPEIFDKLKGKGWLMQVNLLSLAGHYGEPEKKMARYLADNDMIDFLGTDAHSHAHLELISQKANQDVWMQKIQNKYLINKFLTC